MRILFYCDNYHTLRQDTLTKIKAIDSIELDTGNKLQTTKIILSDGSLKSVSIYLVNTLMELLKPVQQECRRACLIPYYIFNSIPGTSQLSSSQRRLKHTYMLLMQ